MCTFTQGHTVLSAMYVVDCSCVMVLHYNKILPLSEYVHANNFAMCIVLKITINWKC